MKSRTSIFSLLLLTAVSGAVAQSLPRDSQALPARPLNLSVRKPAAPITESALIAAEPAPGVTSTSQSPVVGVNEDVGVPANLPYGAGFESRQQGSTTGSGNAGGSGSSGSAGGSGNGGGGRGGAGRGR